MKILISLLLLLNVGVYLWDQSDFAIKPRDPFEARPPIKPESMRLLTTIDKTTELGQSVQPDTPLPEVALSQDQCFRVGPFTSQTTLEKASAKLQSLRLTSDSKTVAARQIRAYRVYLGPFNKKVDVEKQRKQLKKKGIEEFYVIQDAAKETSISLGLFSQQESANKFIDNLKNKEVEAESRQELRTIGERYWIELRAARQDPVALKKMDKLNWGEKRVKLRKVDCREIS